MNIRIGINSYAGFIQFIERIRPELPADVELVITNDLFHELERSVKRLEAEGSVDAFVSAGANADYMEKYLKNTPLIRIPVTGFDVLAAVNSAVSFASRVAVITRHELPALNEVRSLFNVELRCLQYSGTEDLNALLTALYAEGIRDVIGSSFVIDQANLFNMRGHFIYSLESVRSAIMTAISVARTRKEFAEKAKMLDHLMEYAAEGIIITDRSGIITHYNKSAEQIIGRSRSRVLGKNCEEILPNTQLLTVMREKRPQYNRVQDMGNVKIVTNRSPIIVDKEVVGALATFFSVSTIRQAGESIRRSQGSHALAKISFTDLHTDSALGETVRRKAEQYARSTANILLTGESGTGKSIVAQCIHNASSRKNEPFVAFDCAAFSPDTMEAELFGMEDGVRKIGRAGCLERVSGGTLMLDNIQLLPLPLQAKLLHTLEDKEFQRMNGERSLPLDIRFIAASEQDLKVLVHENGFREDLYYLLGVLPLSLPALRERKEDLPLLVREMVLQNRSDLTREEVSEISVLPELLAYDWPGNLYQLQAVLNRFCVLFVPGMNAGALFREILSDNQAQKPVPDPDEKDREDIREALREAEGNRAAAADILGMSRTTLWRRMKELGL